MNFKYLYFIFFIFIICACSHSTKVPEGKAQIKIKLIASGLSGPVSMDCPKDGSGRLFVCEQTGQIKIIKAGQLLATPFLNINTLLDEINKNYSEKGLLGLAFHPDYKNNGKFYIYYSAVDSNKIFDHKSIIAEYKVSSNPDVADVNSGRVVMEIHQPESNHNGGQLAFGPDGYLYIGSGDGGGAGDEHGLTGNGQNLKSWLGKILRINVNEHAFEYDYGIPADNPFISDKKSKPELWAYGLRNPWRFSFDRATGLLFCADVGQNQWEEVDIIEKGKNYGWRIMEAKHCFSPEKDCNTKDLELPIAEYNHSDGICVTGGYVYNGKKIPALLGKYIFADWTGKLFYLEGAAKNWTMKGLMITDKQDNDFKENINSFGEDEAGELYLLTQKSTGPFEKNGSVYGIVNE